MIKKQLNKNTVFKDKQLLSPHYIPELLPFRDSQINDTINILAPVIKGTRPNNLFIYGKPGTGKTSTVKKVIDKIDEIVKEMDSQIPKKVQAHYINCRNHNSKYQIMLKLTNLFYEENFVGYSASFVYEKVQKYVDKNNLILLLVLDEVDLIKDVDEAIYSFSRANDEMKLGSISIIGISNNIMFKEKLDPRTKSSLCQKEIVFTPYNAKELFEILKQRSEMGLNKDCVDDSALSYASAVCAQESGDARIALMLLSRAGEIADERSLTKITQEEVKDARSKVEQELIINMISTLPAQQKLVLYAIASLIKTKKFSVKLLDEEEVLYSGDIYNEYAKIAKLIGKEIVSTKWFKQYLDELDLSGLIISTASGKGVRGNTTLVRLGFDHNTIYNLIKNELEL